MASASSSSAATAGAREPREGDGGWRCEPPHRSRARARGPLGPSRPPSSSPIEAVEARRARCQPRPAWDRRSRARHGPSSRAFAPIMAAAVELRAPLCLGMAELRAPLRVARRRRRWAGSGRRARPSPRHGPTSQLRHAWPAAARGLASQLRCVPRPAREPAPPPARGGEDGEGPPWPRTEERRVRAAPGAGDGGARSGTGEWGCEERRRRGRAPGEQGVRGERQKREERWWPTCL